MGNYSYKFYNFDKDPFPFIRLNVIKQRPEDFKLLERIPFTQDYFKQDRIPFVLNEAQDNEKKATLILLSSNTTSANYDEGHIFEMGLVKLTYSQDRNILLSIDAIYHGYEQVREGLSQDVIKATSVTNEMIQGKSFNQGIIEQIFSDPESIVVADRAYEQRPFFEKRFPQYKNYRFACFIKDLNWDKLGSPLGKMLEALCYARGWFYDNNSSENSSLAMAWLLYLEQNSLSMLLFSERSKRYSIYVYKSFAIKDELKNRNYKYDGKNQCWYITVNTEDELQEEEAFVRQFIRQGVDYRFEAITSRTKYRRSL